MPYHVAFIATVFLFARVQRYLDNWQEVLLTDLELI